MAVQEVKEHLNHLRQYKIIRKIFIYVKMRDQVVFIRTTIKLVKLMKDKEMRVTADHPEKI